MKHVESIERALARMVPAPLSRRATGDLDELIETLAAQQEPAPAAAPFGRKAAVVTGAAAAVIALAAVAIHAALPERPPRAAAAPAIDPFEVVAATNRIDEPEEDEWFADEAGGMHRVVRMRVIEEEFVRDRRSGALVTLTEPREELVLVPVSSF